jgi:hypothetical protein
VNTERPTPGATPPEASDAPTSHATHVAIVRHRTERDASGRIWRFVYDPAAQEALAPSGMVRIRCTTGSARTVLIVRDDWIDWPRVQLLDALASGLKMGRSQIASTVAGVTRPNAPPVDDRALARRRLVRTARGQAWNCVYDPSTPPDAAQPDLVRVRCMAGRDRVDLRLVAGWHRFGDRQLAELIEHALDARGH